VAQTFGGLDVLLTPSAPGEAPEGLASTGDPVFNRVVTLLGFPAFSLPAGLGPSGLPLGVQLVGAPGGEEALLAVAAWIEARLR
jgi:Asp-tRNA(Asn)/Glu-tRNA(Gln) amidotransferase A subunit family amidase